MKITPQGFVSLDFREKDLKVCKWEWKHEPGRDRVSVARSTTSKQVDNVRDLNVPLGEIRVGCGRRGGGWQA